MTHIVTKNKRIIRVSNEFLHNSLSLSAKGLMLYMKTHPTDWEFSIDRMSRALKEGKTAIRNALTELEQQHYIVRNIKRYKKENSFVTKSVYSLANIESEEKYTILSHDVLQHHKISLKAKAVYAIAWSLHSETAFTVKTLAEIIKTSTHTISSTLCELIDHSFLTRKQTKNKGKFAQILYTFFDTPQQTIKKAIKTVKNANNNTSDLSITVSQKTVSQKTNDIDKTYITKNEMIDTITNSFNSFSLTLTQKQQALLVKQQNQLITDIINAHNNKPINNPVNYTIAVCKNYLKSAKSKYNQIVGKNKKSSIHKELEARQNELYTQFRMLDDLECSQEKYEQQRILADEYNAINQQFKDNKRRENISVFEYVELSAEQKAEAERFFNEIFA